MHIWKGAVQRFECADWCRNSLSTQIYFLAKQIVHFLATQIDLEKH